MAAEPRGGFSFVLLAAVGILGILAVVLAGLAFTFLLRPEPPAPEVVVIASPTLRPTFTPVVVAQATPTPTPTPVIQPTAALPGSATRQLPDTGFGPLESAAAGLGLLLVMIAARRARTRTG